MRGGEAAPISGASCAKPTREERAEPQVCKAGDLIVDASARGMRVVMAQISFHVISWRMLKRSSASRAARSERPITGSPRRRDHLRERAVSCVGADGNFERHRAGRRRCATWLRDALGRVVAKLRLEDLAHCGDRDRSRMITSLGTPARSVIVDLANACSSSARCRVARTQGYVRDGKLAGVRVRLADRRGQLDRRMADHGFLDHRGINVVSAADDQVLLAPRQPEAAIGVLPREVAGVEPAVADPDAAVRFLVLVAGKDVRPLDDEMADLVDAAIARVRPSESKAMVFICWYGMRRPIEPTRRTPSRGLTALTHVPSVSPYPSRILTPVASSNLRMSSGGIGAAPQIA